MPRARMRWWVASILVPLLAALIGVAEFRNAVLSLFGVTPFSPFEKPDKEDKERTERLRKLSEELSRPEP